MSKKTKKVVAKSKKHATKKTPKEFIGPDGEFKLDEETRQNLCRYDAEVRASRNQFTVEQMKLGQFIASIDKDGTIAKMQAALQATAMNMQEMEARYSAVRTDVEKRLGINLREYSFDDVTGVLHRHPKPAS